MNFPVPSRRAFTLVEVVLALGILAVAIVAMLGLIGPTLGAVRDAQQINAGTSAMAKMNAILDNAPFYDPNAKSESVWTWLVDSNAAGKNTPTVFIFYDAWPQTVTGTNVITPTMNVARYDFKNNQSPMDNGTKSGAEWIYGTSTTSLNGPGTVDSFISAVTQSRVVGPVIAMTISPSPLMLNFPTTGPAGNEANWYQAPVTNSIFPSSKGLPADPTSGTTSISYPEAYVPLLIQAFVLPTDDIQLGETSAAYEATLSSNLISANRRFTYTYVKLR
jgi:type II secretory pathway pseudopilin PulG